ncbi:MAG TPA: CBS domain-containing protein [Petrotogaceae bacterium]|jgi:anti-sigma regulatory factor (Ser/Thr protein kinase)/predicted transcriptional regulator|nr:CBS domain-containing protein [Petrotogaceae bacterium]HNY36608.1 CBS domain-containing protein [Petrotogaceae bacterium]HOG34621.1 CBS domain-containing protein [Petrotogaceae bacterium]HPA92479.1 CBS domain-containing protein [Petrotogaceae bacterium]HPG48272.1 CBS domain-containing protein [Petrotogaceae bacterium]
MQNDVEKLVEMLSKVFSNTKIKEIMTRPPIVVTQETKIKYVKDIMRIKGISGMPVIAPGFKLVGIISIEDIIRVFENGSFDDRVNKWMTPDPVYLKEDEMLLHFLQVNEDLKYGRYPVVNNDHKVVGVVTKLDILSWMFKKLGYIYVHDERREKALNKKYMSTITGELLDKEGVDFSYKIDYDSVEMIGAAATRLKKFLKEKKIQEDIIRKISIATYEAEANVVIHSSSTGNVYCWIKQDHIKVLIEDFGKGIEDLEQAMKEGFTTAPDNIKEKGFGAGMGLPNMKRFSDRMTIVSSIGKGVKVEILYYIKEK